jgi:hypothetical protein
MYICEFYNLMLRPKVIEEGTWDIFASMKIAMYGEETEPEFFNVLRIPWIVSKELIPLAYVAWRACTTTLFLLGS